MSLAAGGAGWRSIGGCAEGYDAICGVGFADLAAAPSPADLYRRTSRPCADERPHPKTEDLTTIWNGVRDELRGTLPQSAFENWLEPLRAVGVAGQPPLRLGTRPGPRLVPAPLRRRRDRCAAQARARLHRDRLRRSARRHGHASGSPAADQDQPMPSIPAGLADGLDFDRFVIGSGNRFAHSAALAVAESPGESYNPLFLYGAARARQDPPARLDRQLPAPAAARPSGRLHDGRALHLRVRHLAARRTDRPTERFKKRYRGVGALLIDDVQFLEGKARTEDEFFHTFNELYSQGSQIVLSSDRPAGGDGPAQRADARSLRLGADRGDPGTRSGDANRAAEAARRRARHPRARSRRPSADRPRRAREPAPPRGCADPGHRVRLDARRGPQRRARPQGARLADRRLRPSDARRRAPAGRRAARADPGRRLRRPASLPRRHALAAPRRRTSSAAGSSRCTSPATRPTSRSPRSPAASTATTRPSSTRSAGSSAISSPARISTGPSSESTNVSTSTGRTARERRGAIHGCGLVNDRSPQPAIALDIGDRDVLKGFPHP